MKNKSLVLSVLGLVLFGMIPANATSARGGSRFGKDVNYTTTVTTVSLRAGAVYQVITATGAAAEFVALFDSASAIGLTANTITAGVLKTRLFITTGTTAGQNGMNAVYTFDPPLQFNNGIMAANSAATGQVLVIYETGRPTGN